MTGMSWPPPMNWREYDYTPQPGDKIRRPDWEPGVHVVVLTVGTTGLRADDAGHTVYYSRRPGGKREKWEKVE